MPRNRIKGLGLIVVATQVLLACSPDTDSALDGSGDSTQPQPATRPVPLACQVTTPAGGECVTLVQHPLRPAETDQGYATELSWTLTNQCANTMKVGWNWMEGDVGETTLSQGQSTDVSCLWNVDGCTGNIQFEYRCAETP